MRYVDLMGGQKPHLLVRSVNNLGAETARPVRAVHPFYLQDKRDGKPWITALPFPCTWSSASRPHDRVSRNRFVTRYAYHHGYFDGVEREFRGFGMVEQWDTEEFAAYMGAAASPTSSPGPRRRQRGGRVLPRAGLADGAGTCIARGRHRAPRQG
jgi:hypothetical protein